MKKLLFFFSIFFHFGVTAQNGWEWSELADMPDSTTNNALCGALVDGEKYVYSFGGISDTLTYADIHQRVYKYSVLNNIWTEEVSMPDTLGKIAAGASFVNNKIYVIGGYHVDENGNEYSSDRVHVYNPFLDTFEVDAAPVPVPIDDHVQAVWRDSLIYVVSGWSNTNNVPDVQIYNPYFDSWSVGTEVPNNNTFKSFGASGYVLEDTIYYYGGVAGSFSFTARDHVRRGIINPNDPTDITWEYLGDASGGSNYRSACSGHNSTVFWVGGAEEAYNFDAIAYNGSDIVNPNRRILSYNVQNKVYSNTFNTQASIMDLRGIAKLGGGNWIIAGGLDSLQEVSNKTYLLHNTSLSDIDDALQPPFFEVLDMNDFYRVRTENVGDIEVYDIAGRKLFSQRKQLADLIIPKSEVASSMLIFIYNDGTNVPVTRKKVQP